MKVSAKITIEGRVQGVGYRWFAKETADKLKLQGTVENLDNGKVYIYAEGESDAIHEFITLLKRGPSLSRVTDIQVQWGECSGLYSDFKILI